MAEQSTVPQMPINQTQTESQPKQPDTQEPILTQDQLKQVCLQDPLNTEMLMKYIQILADQGLVDLQLEAYEKAVSYNAAQLHVWLLFLDFTFEEIYINKQDEIKARQIYERAIDSVGDHFLGGDIWTKYIDFEVMLNNMGQASVLFLEGIKAGSDKSSELLEGFKKHIDDYFDKITEDLGNESASINQKHKETHSELVKHVLSDCKSDKFEFLKLLSESGKFYTDLAEKRRPYEERLIQSSDKQVWLDYINWEVDTNNNLRRAKQLYERALISHNKDIQLWLSYVRFVVMKIRDLAQARALFIKKQNHSDKFQKIDIAFEEAKFEEDQGFIQKARKIHEKIQNEMAPGYAKALIEFINFERRQKSIEKSKEMLFKLYKDALEKGNPDFIAWVSFQYANFMLYDMPRAIEVYKNAFDKVTSSRMLCHQFLNFVRSNNLYTQENEYLKKVVHDSLLSETLSHQHKVNLAFSYFNFVNEKAQTVREVQDEEQWLKQHGLLGQANEVANKFFSQSFNEIVTQSKAQVENGSPTAKVGRKRLVGEREEGGEEGELEEGEVKRLRQL